MRRISGTDDVTEPEPGDGYWKPGNSNAEIPGMLARASNEKAPVPWWEAWLDRAFGRFGLDFSRTFSVRKK